jgi:hypothetical protein
MTAQWLADALEELVTQAIYEDDERFESELVSADSFERARVLRSEPGFVVVDKDGGVFHVVVTRASFPPEKDEGEKAVAKSPGEPTPTSHEFRPTSRGREFRP